MPSGEILKSEFFSRQISMTINGVTLRADLIAIEMKEFDVILGMDFLEKHNAIIDCHHRKVTFRPKDGEQLACKGRSLLNHKMVISSSQEQWMLTCGCMGFLASTIDKSKEEVLDPTDVSVCKGIYRNFPRRIARFTSSSKNFFWDQVITRNRSYFKVFLPNDVSRIKRIADTIARIAR